MTHLQRPFLYVGICALVLLVGIGPMGSVQAETIFLTTLTGAQEVPPNRSPATGFGTFRLNDTSTALSFDVEYSGLVGGSVSGAHFHQAPPGVNGPIVRGLDTTGAGLSGAFRGVWSATDADPLTPPLVSALFDGDIYFNIHTTPGFPGGEIRGQLEPIPEPSTGWLLTTALVSLFLWGVRRSAQQPRGHALRLWGACSNGIPAP